MTSGRTKLLNQRQDGLGTAGAQASAQSFRGCDTQHVRTVRPTRQHLCARPGAALADDDLLESN